MNSVAPKAELALRDIQLPDSSLWWPPAPGWWMLLLLTIIIVALFVVYKKTYNSRQVKKNTKLELEHYYQDYVNNKDQNNFIQQLSALLRRVCLYRFRDETIAMLQGEQWLEFLDSTLPKTTNAQHSFSHGVGTVFLSGPYQKNIATDISAVHELVELWLNFNLKNKRRVW